MLLQNNGWSPIPPRSPGHFWVIVPGWEHEPHVEHIQDRGGVLKVLDEDRLDWRPIPDVYSAEHDYLWWGPLTPPEQPTR